MLDLCFFSLYHFIIRPPRIQNRVTHLQGEAFPPSQCCMKTPHRYRQGCLQSSVQLKLTINKGWWIKCKHKIDISLNCTLAFRLGLICIELWQVIEHIGYLILQQFITCQHIMPEKRSISKVLPQYVRSEFCTWEYES